jgi:hypothetical protein
MHSPCEDGQKDLTGSVRYPIEQNFRFTYIYQTLTILSDVYCITNSRDSLNCESLPFTADSHSLKVGHCTNHLLKYGASESTTSGREPNPLDTTGLCLLSLDGCGARELSMLYILKSIMDRLNHKRKNSNLLPVKPCEVFDLIGGTDIGR